MHDSLLVRINWERCGKKGIQHKMVGMIKVGYPGSLDGVASIQIVGASAFVISPCTKNTIVG